MIRGPNTPARVLVVEDDPRFREQLAELLGGAAFEPHLASTGQEALKTFATIRPDVCLLDLGLPDVDGEDLIRRLQGLDPGVPLVVLTVATARAKILGALRAGALGYVLKEDLYRVGVAIEDALAGGAPMSRQVARVVLSQVRDADLVPAKGPEHGLTPREVEVVESLSRGLTYANVASALGMSTNTVRQHVRSIYYKLAVASKTEAVLEALRLGVIRASS